MRCPWLTKNKNLKLSIKKQKKTFFQKCDKIRGQTLAEYKSVCYNEKKYMYFIKYRAGKKRRGMPLCWLLHNQQKTLSEGRQTKRKSDKVGGFSMIQKQAYEQLRLQLLFIAEDDVVRTSNFTSGEEGDGTGEDSGTKLPGIFD